MGAEIQLFLLNSLFDRNSINDVLLGSIFDSNKSQSKRDIFSLNHSFGVCSFVHDINFGDDSDSSNTFWIELSCHL